MCSGSKRLHKEQVGECGGLVGDVAAHVQLGGCACGSILGGAVGAGQGHPRHTVCDEAAQRAGRDAHDAAQGAHRAAPAPQPRHRALGPEVNLLSRAPTIAKFRNLIDVQADM